jgi:hypothetical protein
VKVFFIITIDTFPKESGVTIDMQYTQQRTFTSSNSKAEKAARCNVKEKELGEAGGG